MTLCKVDRRIRKFQLMLTRELYFMAAVKTSRKYNKNYRTVIVGWKKSILIPYTSLIAACVN